MPQINSPSIKISQNGKAWDNDNAARIEELIVTDEINVPTMFSIKMNMADMGKGAWRGIDMTSLVPGDSFEISMGNDKAQSMVKGDLVGIEPEFSENSWLIIRGYDRLHRLRFGKKRRSFQSMKDEDIIKKIASDAGFSVKCDTTSTEYPYILQNNESDYHFLIRRAQRIGFEVSFDDKTLICKKSGESNSPGLTLEYGLDIPKFSAKLNTLSQGSEVELCGWDPATKKALTGKAGKGAENSKMGGKKSGFEISTPMGQSKTAIIDQYLIDDSEGDTIAKAQYNLSLQNFITANGICQGNPAVRAGQTIKVKGLGDRFSGIYYVISSNHQYSVKGGYMTSFKVRRTGI